MRTSFARAPPTQFCLEAEPMCRLRRRSKSDDEKWVPDGAPLTRTFREAPGGRRRMCPISRHDEHVADASRPYPADGDVVVVLRNPIPSDMVEPIVRQIAAKAGAATPDLSLHDSVSGTTICAAYKAEQWADAAKMRAALADGVALPNGQTAYDVKKVTSNNPLARDARLFFQRDCGERVPNPPMTDRAKAPPTRTAPTSRWTCRR